VTGHLELPLGTREFLPVAVSATEDLTSHAVELAFPPEGTGPTVWHPAAWSDEINVARIRVVEPGADVAGSVELGAGYFDVWARVEGAGQRSLFYAGRLEVYEPGSSAYDRWRMTVGEASRLTGVSGLSARDLERAEADLIDEIGWSPDVRHYNHDDAAYSGLPVDRRVVAMGRAIAWQAALRSETPAKPDDGLATEIASESVGRGDYVVNYADGRGIRPISISPRAVELLRGAGWYAPSSAGRARI
jgi:hypothetical protein